MYISYDGLWRLLAEKRMSKGELSDLTGISSRTIAKLAKNETVTTDTLIKICEVLDCELSDIAASRKGESRESFYDAFRRRASITAEDAYFKIYSLTYEGKPYIIKKTKKIAGKHTVIWCENDSIVWEQIYPLGRSPLPVKTVLTKRSFAPENTRGIVLISGFPMGFVGLDDDGFVSAKGRAKEDSDVIVMSYGALKNFEIK